MKQQLALLNPMSLRLPSSDQERKGLLKCGWLALVCFAPLCSWGQPNSDLPFDSGSTGADGNLVFPRAAGTQGAGGAYDAARNQIVYFGGLGAEGRIDDTWVFDGTTWNLVQPANSPSARNHTRMVYFASQSRCILFGGHDGSTRLNDTWAWDGASWTLLNPPNSPPGRSHHGMVYDSANNRIILFGGFSDQVADGALGDTWAFDGTTWSQLSPANAPAARWGHGMAFDSLRQEIVLACGFDPVANNRRNDTWIFKNGNWTEANPARTPNAMQEQMMAYDPVRTRVVLYGGRTSSDTSNFLDTWLWDGNTWSTPNERVDERNDAVMVWHALEEKVYMVSGFGDDYVSSTHAWNGSAWETVFSQTFLYDMSGKPDGVWNYGSIYLPSGLRVKPTPNTANTPLVWLATDNVVISGHLDLNAEDGGPNNQPGGEARGGPGGYSGGLGGTRFDVSGSFAGQPGFGPGGGLPGASSGQIGSDGTYNETYGNAFIQPLVGGSGGGGGASDADGDGGNGGGGGGAVKIASSRDILVAGTISANGGNERFGTSGGGRGGEGSGGAIRLVADRVLGDGILEAKDGGGTRSGETTGRIRVEGYFRTLVANAVTPITASAPTQQIDVGGNIPALLITQVAGENVTQPPTGSLSQPDVVFSDSGPVTVTVTAQNIPDGTAVRLRIVSSGSIIELPASGAQPVVLSGGTAIFTATVPSGLGSLQAFAEFNVQN